MRQFMAITKALADENRVRVLMFLRSGELCVCQVIEMLGLAPSTVSKHLAILEQARLVDRRKVGRWIHYRRPDTGAPACVGSALRWLDRSLAGDPEIVRDRRHLKTVLALDPEALCRRQRRS